MESIELQKKEDTKNYKLTLSMSQDRIGRDPSDVVLGTRNSQQEDGKDNDDDPMDDNDSNDDARELFSGLLGNDGENALQV